eukprot:2640144-Amphidinium_carterae.1
MLDAFLSSLPFSTFGLMCVEPALGPHAVGAGPNCVCVCAAGADELNHHLTEACSDSTPSSRDTSPGR